MRWGRGWGTRTSPHQILRDGDTLPVISLLAQTKMNTEYSEADNRIYGLYNIISFAMMLGAGALRRPRGMVRGGRWEGGSGWGTHVYLWWIHVDVWQNQHNTVK